MRVIKVLKSKEKIGLGIVVVVNNIKNFWENKI